MKKYLNFLSSDLAIDLGTVNTLIHHHDNGIVLNEPSILAVDKADLNMGIIAIGSKAKEMHGRTPENIETIKPMREGIIADYLAAEEMLKYFISKSLLNKNLFSPRLMICVPASSTPAERKAILDSGLATGARKVFLIEEPMAAAIGSDLPINEAKGSMIIDIGGGTTEIAIISLGGIVFSKSIRVGGNEFDKSIISNLRRNENIHIGEITAEQLKIQIGSGIIPKHCDGRKMTIKGKEITEGVPVEKEITERHISESLAEALFEITETIKEAFESAPPELTGDIYENGILLTGGGSLLDNMDVVIERATGLKVKYAEEPLSSVALGSGKVMKNIKTMRDTLSTPYGRH